MGAGKSSRQFNTLRAFLVHFERQKLKNTHEVHSAILTGVIAMCMCLKEDHENLDFAFYIICTTYCLQKFPISNSSISETLTLELMHAAIGQASPKMKPQFGITQQGRDRK